MKLSHEEDERPEGNAAEILEIRRRMAEKFIEAAGTGEVLMRQTDRGEAILSYEGDDHFHIEFLESGKGFMVVKRAQAIVTITEILTLTEMEEWICE